MKNIFLLPTAKSKIYKEDDGLLCQDEILSSYGGVDHYHIYITSDDEIDDVRPVIGKWQLESGYVLNKFPNYLTDLSECKLIIFTTDPDLIKDGVQEIDENFLKWFIKNPSDVAEFKTYQELNGLNIDNPSEVLYTLNYELITPVVICVNCKEFHYKGVSQCNCGGKTFENTDSSNAKSISLIEDKRIFTIEQMLEFAEWCDNNFWRVGNTNKWVENHDFDSFANGPFFTTKELLNKLYK